ncbi:Transcriptional activator spt7 [Stygiomarasmius scandens]|uniref:Transcriptional activator spt7 n=1 Tax=Marasmiellus scandens TaxID=2682957 RepID=A0ABR1K4P2_9AGAR
MNNLLRTLTESQVRPNSDLKLLLSSVKEYRRAQQSHDTKLADPFYDSLEGLLVDLKTVTIDNRDAEAFLKPVVKAEVPDYYDVISNPMDFQTMSRKVKAKQYKSKKEFKDDLDLIWTNCFTYNASEKHPLRKCAQRLQIKAEKLLANITDRKERTDPPIPPELASTRIKLNGVLTNGRTHTRSPSLTKAPSKVPTPQPGKAIVKIPRQNVKFEESPAIVRTPEGMALFRELDKSFEAGPSRQVIEHLRQLAPHVEYEADPEPGDVGIKEEVDDSAILGDKRKVSPLVPERPLKRARLDVNGASSSSSSAYDKALPLWWGAAQSDFMLANGLPEIPFSSSHAHRNRKPHPFQVPQQPIPKSEPANRPNHVPVPISAVPSTSSALLPSSSSSSSHPTPNPNSINPTNQHQPKPKRKKKRKKPHDESSLEPYRPEDHPKALLTLMNNNIRTMKRVRHTHAKFAALGLTKDGGGGGEGDGDGDNPPAGTGVGTGAGIASGVGGAGGAGGNVDIVLDEVTDDQIDDRPWSVPLRRVRPNPTLDSSLTPPTTAYIPASGIDLGPQHADDCLRWTNTKVLEHAGFQGTSRAALDVLVGVTSEYLFNVGRTIRFLCDKFGSSGRMSAEEIVLHTLFESGTAKVQDLERYIKDDVERYGGRLGELERKIIGAYREATAVETLEDEGLFEEEDEEEASALALGEFGDEVGLDYFGLKELGIADEFGLSSLTVPKRLLRRKKMRNVEAPAAKPTEPPPPFPPPPPFIPLTSDKIPDQIGLLQPYYSERVKSLAPPPPPPTSTLPPSSTSSLASIPTLSGPSIPGIPPLSGPQIQIRPIPTASSTSTSQPYSIPSIPASTPSTSSLPSIPGSIPAPVPTPPRDLILPDDQPSASQVKMGPLGQIIKVNAAQAGAKKKKDKDKDKGGDKGANANAGMRSAGPGGSAGGVGGGGIGILGGNLYRMASPADEKVGIVGVNGNGIGGGVGVGGAGLIGAVNNGVNGTANSGVNGVNGIGNGTPMVVDGTGAGTTTGGAKKKKSATGVGSGNGRKKKGANANGTNGVDGQGQQGQGGQGGQRSSFPPAVTASA